MNTPTVTSPYSFSDNQVNDIIKAFTDLNSLPEIRTVYVYHISKQFKSYGHWALNVSVEIDGKRFELSAITTDSMMIDNWQKDGEINLDTLVSAFDRVITANELEIADVLIAEIY